LALDMRRDNYEGLIFRQLDAPYREGRSKDLIKIKFRHTVDCVVTDLRRDKKANMALGLFDDSQLVEVAECTALAGDKNRIRIGDVVEVTYLYASADNRLVQPTKPVIRTDKFARECTLDQLVYPNKSVRLG